MECQSFHITGQSDFFRHDGVYYKPIFVRRSPWGVPTWPSAWRVRCPLPWPTVIWSVLTARRDGPASRARDGLSWPAFWIPTRSIAQPTHGWIRRSTVTQPTHGWLWRSTSAHARVPEGPFSKSIHARLWRKHHANSSTCQCKSFHMI